MLPACFIRRLKKLYCGTAEKGAVYSFDGNKLHAEYQSAEHIVTGIAKDKEDNLYVATAGKGNLVKIDAAGNTKTLESSEAFYSLFYNPDSDQVLAGDAEGDITTIGADPLTKRNFYLPVSQTHQEAVLCLASDNHGRLFAGTANLGEAHIFDTASSDPATYTSEVRDGTRTARWSRLRLYDGHYESEAAAEKELKVESRTGESSQPDGSWSSWTEAAYYKDGSFTLKAPSGRYMQYKLTWLKSAEVGLASVGKVEVTYLPTNSRPDFGNVSLKTGATITGKETITIAGTDPDGDNLLLALDFSSDGGKSWESLTKDLRPKSKTKDSPAIASSLTSGKGSKTSTKTRENDKNHDTEGGAAGDDKSSKLKDETTSKKDGGTTEQAVRTPDWKSENSTDNGMIQLDDALIIVDDKPAVTTRRTPTRVLPRSKTRRS